MNSDNIFLNLSNHPSAYWADEQMKAAQAIAPRILDFRFPNVPPEWGTLDIRNLADKIVNDLLSLDNGAVMRRIKGAMLQGEHTLTFALVHRFQQHGVPCYAATTERQVEDADGRKTSVFRFVRFRAYPRLW